MSKASEVWAKIKDEMAASHATILAIRDLDAFDKFAVREIEKVAVSDVEPITQADSPRVDFRTDKKGDGTPLLVAVSSAIREPEDGKVRIDSDHALVVRYLNGSVNISTARVPL